jgi:hypothetical protein
LVIASLVICTNAALAEEEIGIRIPKEVMEQAVAANDAKILITDYFIPALKENDAMVLVFASELNISNGRKLPNPYDIPFGERGMFGKLIYAPSLYIDRNKPATMTNIKPEFAENVEAIRNEAIRLLVGDENGEWYHPKRGQTQFTFSSRSDVRILSYESGKWIQHKGTIYTIKVKHIVEYMGGTRWTTFECDWKHLMDNSYYLVSFQIVRK